MIKVLITGGAGFIGSTLANFLIKRNFEVSVLDNLSPQIHGEIPDRTSPLYQSIKGKVNFILGSVTNRDDLVRACQDQDIIVHLAAETGTGQSMYKIHHYVDVNISGTAILLDVMTNTKHKVKKIIVASSRSIYGEGRYFSEELNAYVYPEHRLASDMNKGDFEVKYPRCTQMLQVVATDESSKIHPSSVYGITKQNQEQLIMTVCPTIGIEPVAFRYQNVYGPGQSLSNPYTGILSIFSTLIRNNQSINIFEDGLESRDFVYIDDVIKATVMGIEKDEANGQVYNVGSGIPTTVNQVAQELMKNLFSVPTVVSGNYRVGDIRHNYADLTKITRQLGFKPSVGFSEGIIRFTDWVKSQSIFTSKFQDSIDEMKSKGLLK